MARPPLDVCLRPLRVADAAAMVPVLADPSLYRFTGGEPPTLSGLTRRYEVQTRGGPVDGSQRWLNFVVVAGDAPVGYVQATIPTAGGPAEIAWVVGRPWQGRGVATAAARQLLAELASRGVREVVAHIHPEHAASDAVAERIGMTRTDVVVDGETRWQLRLPRVQGGDG